MKKKQKILFMIFVSRKSYKYKNNNLIADILHVSPFANFEYTIDIIMGT